MTTAERPAVRRPKDAVELHVGEVIQETTQDRTFVLPIPAEHRDAFRFVPGQFVVVLDPDADTTRPRAYSISSSADVREDVRVTVRDMGTFGRIFYRFPVGKRLWVRPPRGTFTLDLETERDVVLVAGGSGVTPFHCFVAWLAAHAPDRRALLVQSARTSDDLIFWSQFDAWGQALPGFTYVPTVTRATDDDPWSGRRGRVDTALLADHVRAAEKTLLYACGPDAFVGAMLALAEDLGIPEANRFKEAWG